jgi:hypothetical protein
MPMFSRTQLGVNKVLPLCTEQYSMLQEANIFLFITDCLFLVYCSIDVMQCYNVIIPMHDKFCI